MIRLFRSCTKRMVVFDPDVILTLNFCGRLHH